MKTYRVKWEIDVRAASPKEAAQRALEIQRNPESTAIFFEVTEHDDYSMQLHAPLGDSTPVAIDLLEDAEAK